MKIIADAKIKNIEVELSEAKVVANMIHGVIGNTHGHRSFILDGASLYYEDNPEWSEHTVNKYFLIRNDAAKVEKFLLLDKLYKIITGEAFCTVRLRSVKTPPKRSPERSFSVVVEANSLEEAISKADKFFF